MIAILQCCEAAGGFIALCVGLLNWLCKDKKKKDV